MTTEEQGREPTLADTVLRHEGEIHALKQRLTPRNEYAVRDCAVKDCTNNTGQGLFHGLLCTPCHTFISGGGGLYSQAYRNSRKMIDTAVEMERALVKQPTKICGTNLVGILNSAGFYKKDEWVGLTAGEAAALWASTDDRDSFELLKRVEAKLKEKNGETH